MNPARKTILPAAEASTSRTPDRATVSGLQAVRRAIDANDNVLHDRAIHWLATLPTDVRPMATGRHYPRIVNRISDLWSQCEYTRLHFQSLLIDRREGREGFPPEVRRELLALQHHYFVHLSGLPAILWNAVPLYPPRIPNRAFALHTDTTEIDIPPL